VRYDRGVYSEVEEAGLRYGRGVYSDLPPSDGVCVCVCVCVCVSE
jgi:hypothetical protein